MKTLQVKESISLNIDLRVWNRQSEITVSQNLFIFLNFKVLLEAKPDEN